MIKENKCKIDNHNQIKDFLKAIQKIYLKLN